MTVQRATKTGTNWLSYFRRTFLPLRQKPGNKRLTSSREKPPRSVYTYIHAIHTHTHISFHLRHHSPCFFYELRFTVPQTLANRVAMSVLPTHRERVRCNVQICKHDYRIVFIMSNFCSDSWFMWWVSRMRTRLSSAHRANLRAMTIVHSSIVIRFLCAAASVWHGNSLWKKLHFADRVECLSLDGILTKQQIATLIPKSVAAYESVLEEEAREARRQAVLLGAPLSPIVRPDDDSDHDTSGAAH